MNEQDSIFYINKDNLGSFDVITSPDGTVKERYNYDPCVVRRSLAKAEGRRRNPADWSYNNIAETYYIDRGFNGYKNPEIPSFFRPSAPRHRLHEMIRALALTTCLTALSFRMLFTGKGLKPGRLMVAPSPP